MLKEIIDFKTWLKREDDHPRTRNPEEPSDRKPQETHMDSPPAETPAALSRSKPRTRPSSLLHPPSIIRSSSEEKEKRQHSIPQNSSETLDHRKNQEQNETQAFSTAPSPSTPLLPPPPPLPPPPSSSSTPAHCCPAPPPHPAWAKLGCRGLFGLRGRKRSTRLQGAPRGISARAPSDEDPRGGGPVNMTVGDCQYER